MGALAVAAGICAIAAGLWNYGKRKSWLLILNGLASSALGLLLTFWTGRIAFHTIALLIVLMAMSLGIYAVAIAQTLRRHPAVAWFVGTAGAVSFAFALSFSALGFGWLKLQPSSPTLFWIGSYFVLSALCKLALALRLPGRAAFIGLESLPGLANPKIAH
jgi:uncharacterized membrane protein HdeD (DUF308 family)